MDNVSESFAAEGSQSESPENNSGGAPASTGNDRERLKVYSGKVLFIDQFLLANQQLSAALLECSEETEALRRFGALSVELPSGEYAIFRDPHDRVMIIYPATEELSTFDTPGSLPTPDEIIDGITAKDVIGAVRIETRAVTFADAGVLKDAGVIDQYRTLWRSGDRKGARDFLRSKGAAVRYGFNHRSDEMRIARSQLPGVLAMRV